MVGRALSKTKKQQLSRIAHDELMSCAVDFYCSELAKPRGERRKGARKICKDLEALHLRETGVLVKLSFSTLMRLATGGRTKALSNADCSWLSLEETLVVIEYTIEMGNRGFPLSHRRLKEHVDEICQARLGSSFPADG